MLKRLILVAAGLALLAPSAHAADTTLARLPASTTISAGSGIVLYSAYDKATERYSLMQIEPRALYRLTEPERVPVATSPTPFDADVGPTASGQPFYVYERCEKGKDASCDIYAFNPRTGREQRSKASDPKHAEYHATYWKGRLAFVRDYGTENAPRQIVYQRPDPSSRRSTRLPGLPARRCSSGGCSEVTGTIDALELQGSNLAQTAFSTRKISLGGGDSYDSNTAELRLVDADTGRSQQLSGRGSGESGQNWSAISFDRGRLYAYFACFGDPSGCNTKNAGAYRYDYVKDRWALAGSTERLEGFAVDGSTYELATNVAGGCGPVDGPDTENATCDLVRKQPNLTYAPTKAP